MTQKELLELYDGVDYLYEEKIVVNLHRLGRPVEEIQRVSMLPPQKVAQLVLRLNNN